MKGLATAAFSSKNSLDGVRCLLAVHIALRGIYLVSIKIQEIYRVVQNKVAGIAGAEMKCSGNVEGIQISAPCTGRFWCKEMRTSGEKSV